jgi:glycosyltransferase involved in cell wall biosynthesis
VADRTLLVVSQRPLDLGGGGSVRWRHLRRALPQHGWRMVECSPPAGATAHDTSTDLRLARLAARRARFVAVVRRVIGPLVRLLGVEPEALAPNNAWAVTGRRLVRAAITRERPNVIVATGPPPSALVAAAAVAGDTPLVLDLRDLWAGNPYYDRGSRLLAAVQARTFASAAAIVTVTDGCRDALLNLHPTVAPRLHVLPNGFDPILLERRRPASWQANGYVTLIHAGALYGDRTAEPLLAALGRPELRDRVRLVLLGVVDPRTRRALSKAHHLDATAEPSVDWEKAIERVLASDIVVVINAPSTGGDMAVPTKLYEALALGRPLLALARQGGDTARLLERLGQETGLAPPDDPGAIAAAIERLLSDPPQPVPPEALADFDRDRIAARYAALLDDVATRSSNATSSGTTFSRR